MNLGWSELRGLEAGDYRFILAPSPELYDLTKDPGERENRIESNPTVADRLERSLASLMESMGPSVGRARQAVDPQTEEMLLSLGYLSTSQPPPQDGSSVVDPKDKMELWTKIESGLALFSQGDDAGALVIFKKALAEDNDIPILYDHIGWSHIRLNQYDQAERVYRQAIEHGFDSADLRANLGLIYYRWGEFAKAEKELRIALTLEESSIYRPLPSGRRLSRNQELPEGREQYRRVLEINPDYVWALNGLGMTLAMDGKERGSACRLPRCREDRTGNGAGLPQPRRSPRAHETFPGSPGGLPKVHGSFVWRRVRPRA